MLESSDSTVSSVVDRRWVSRKTPGGDSLYFSTDRSWHAGGVADREPVSM